MTDQEFNVLQLKENGQAPNKLSESSRKPEDSTEKSLQERVFNILSIIKEKLPESTQAYLLHEDKIALTNSVEAVLQSLASVENLSNEQLKKVQEYLAVIDKGMRTLKLKNFGPGSKLVEIDDKMAFVQLSKEIDSLNKDISAKIVLNQFTSIGTMQPASSTENIAAD